MKREHFVRVVEEVLDSLPQEFRSRIRNVAVLVEDVPPNQPSPQSGQQRRLLLGLVEGDNRPGLGYAIAQALAHARINLTFLVAQVIGKKYSAVIGFETAEDAKQASALIKKASRRAGK